jgi:hypothetical protein
MPNGDFLNPKIDNSHSGERKLYRTLNLLYYVTSFSAHPEQTVRRWIAAVDNAARTEIRKLFRKGIGRKDQYRPDQPK